MTNAEEIQNLGDMARETEKPTLKFSRSDDIDKFAGAMAKAQGAMRSAEKSSANPFYGSKYADLAAVVDAIRKPLSDNGISYLQPFTTGPKSITVSTFLMHESGQWVATEATFPVLPLPKKGEPINPNGPITPQAYGSAEAYLRRYALQSMLGLAADDDDGNSASGVRDDAPKGNAAVREAVGRVSRPSTASAKAAEQPKAPEPHKAEPLPQSPEAAAVALRFAALWEKAKRAKTTRDDFKEFTLRVLGADKKSSEMDVDEIGLLEAAWATETAREGSP